MNNIFEKNSLTLILLKIFDIYLCHYFATNKKIAITHLIAKDKVFEEKAVTAIVLSYKSFTLSS